MTLARAVANLVDRVGRGVGGHATVGHPSLAGRLVWGALLAVLAIAVGWAVWRRGVSAAMVASQPRGSRGSLPSPAWWWHSWSGPGRWPPPGWVIVACDVGQGDALVVNLGDRAAMVIDAGPDPALIERCLDRLGVEHVPLLVLTHFHADHVGGVPGVLATSQVDTVLVSPLRDPPEQASSVGQWTTGLEVVEAVPGQAGAWGDASWRVLWPGEAH